MTNAMIAVKIFEMTSNGLQEIVELPTTAPLHTDEEQREAIDSIVNMAYENDKMFLSMEYIGFSIQGLKNKTIVVRGVFEGSKV